jgi:hypothetical protein
MVQLSAEKVQLSEEIEQYMRKGATTSGYGQLPEGLCNVQPPEEMMQLRKWCNSGSGATQEVVQLSAERVQLPEKMVLLLVEIIQSSEEMAQLPQEMMQLPDEKCNWHRK